MDSTPAASGVQILELTLTLAGTEYSQELHDGVFSTPSLKCIQFRAQDPTHTLDYAFKTGGPYFHLAAGEVYWKDSLHIISPFSVYFKSTSAGAVVEIEEWK